MKTILICSFIYSIAIALSPSLGSAQVLENTNSTAQPLKIIRLDSAATDVVWRPLTDAIRGPAAGGSTAFMSVDFNRTVGTFKGELKLDAAGKGFASYRASSLWDLSDIDQIQFMAKGDGRPYKLLLKDTRGAATYEAEFKTVNDQWVPIAVDISAFVPISRGRVVTAPPLVLAAIEEFGLQINDGKAGIYALDFSEISGLKTAP